tara:strand:- start:20 stop:454 length:435 start_codon:yes stop_codon:yes gene_type:complete
MANSKAAAKNEPSAIELAETFNAAIKELRESVSQRLELIEAKFSEEVTKLGQTLKNISTESKLPDVENFIRSAKIAGELSRSQMFEMTFQAVVAGFLSNERSYLFKTAGNTEAALANREREVDRVLSVTDTFMEALEHYFQPEE